MSRSGESGEIARFAGEVQAQGGKLLAITMTPDSTLAGHADILVHDPASFDGLICTKAFTSLALTGLLIAAETEGALTAELQSQLKEHFQWMETDKDRLLDRIQMFKPLETAGVVYFLSRGVGMTAAAMGALLMEEAAWQPASLYSFGMFHHGPLEVVDETFAGFWIDLDPDERSRELFAEVNSKQGLLIAVSHREDLYPRGILLPSGGLPEPFRVFSAAFVVQLAAYNTAVARGRQPGEMRYLNWLVT